MLKKNRIGQKFGRLIVLKEIESRRYPSGKLVRFFMCQCVCGKEHVTNVNALRSGDVRSCGCLAKEGNRKTHGMTGKRFYTIWSSLAQRHKRKDKPTYSHVRRCARWSNFEVFKKDMHSSYLSHIKKFGIADTTIDRKNNSLGYTLSNCRWATRLTQVRNKRKKFTFRNLSKVNTSGYKGMSWYKSRQRWHVRKVGVYSRYFKNKKEAICFIKTYV